MARKGVGTDKRCLGKVRKGAQGRRVAHKEGADWGGKPRCFEGHILAVGCSWEGRKEGREGRTTEKVGCKDGVLGYRDREEAFYEKEGTKRERKVRSEDAARGRVRSKARCLEKINEG